MFCAISGEAPKEPVISTTNGILFEKRLIEKFLKEDVNSNGNGSGLCPVTQTPLSLADLLPVQINHSTSSRPRVPISECSTIPGLLSTFQNEWDELMLETFTLKQHLDTTRKELSRALFQHEAACRVIARLTRERDEAYHMVNTLEANAANNVANNASTEKNPTTNDTGKMAVDNNMDDYKSHKLEANIIQELENKCKELSATRKGRKGGVELATKDAMKTLERVNSWTPHKADNKTGGVACLALSTSFLENGNLASLSGSLDKNAILMDVQNGKVISTLTGHTKRVSCVSFLGDSQRLLTASADKSMKVWELNGKKCGVALNYDGHDSEVVAMTVHPTNNFVVSVCADNYWNFIDINQGKLLKKVKDEESTKYSSCAFHPDGLILGTTSFGGCMKVWDVREQQNVFTATDHTDIINSIAFSENGYTMATGSSDGSVKMYDLRKLKCLQSIKIDQPVASVSFDYSGTYLGIAANTDLQVKVVKDYSELANLRGENSKTISQLCWGANAKTLVTCSMDRTIKVYKPKE